MADISSATGKAGMAANTPSLGAYADVIKSHGAVPNGNKVIRLSEDALKRLPIRVELNGKEPRGTIVLPTESVTSNSNPNRKLSGTVDYLGIEGTLVPEPYDFRRRAGGRNDGFIYGEGSWWSIDVTAGELGCSGDPNRYVGTLYYWWAAGSTGNWWLLSVYDTTYNASSECRLSDFDPVAVGAGTPPTPPPSSTPSMAPSPTPTPRPIKLEAESAFSPNGDGTKDTAKIDITAEGPWTLEVDGAGVIKPGSGDHSFLWDGTVDGSILLDGKYTLTLKAGGQEKVAEIIVDKSKPAININSIKAQSWSSDGRSVVMVGNASIADRGLAGLDSLKTKIGIVGKDVSSSSSNISPDGSSIDFTYTVTPPTRGKTAYKLNAIDTVTELEAGAVAVNISAYDNVGNGAGQQFNFDFYYPENSTGMARSGQVAFRDAPLPEVQPKQEVPPAGIDYGKYVKYLKNLGRLSGMGMVIIAASELPYDPQDAAPPPPPPGPPRPRPGPGPEPSPSPSPSISFTDGKLFQTTYSQGGRPF